MELVLSLYLAMQKLAKLLMVMPAYQQKIMNLYKTYQFLEMVEYI